MKYKNIFKNKSDIRNLYSATSISTEILSQIYDFTVEGVSSVDIDEYANSLCKKYGVEPAFLDIPNSKSRFGHSLCVSVNEFTLHTRPTSTASIQSGDIVKLDFGIVYKGIYTDHCVTKGIGNISEENQRLIEIGKECIAKGIENAKVGKRIGDISNALETICINNNANFVLDYTGHGIGKFLWLDPAVPSFGEMDTGPYIEDGMVLCIENQITFGNPDLILESDGWSLKTKDGSTSVMFEHMIYVTRKETKILTNFL